MRPFARRHFALPAALAAVFLLSACATTSSSQEGGKEGMSRSEIYLKLGVSYLQQGDSRKALRKLNKAESLSDGDARIYNALGLTYQQLGFDEKAEDAFQEAVNLDSKNPQVRNNYGAFLAQMGAYERAREQFEQALEDPLYNRPEKAYYNLGWLAKRQGDQERAEDMLRTALRLAPNYPAARLALARLLKEQGRGDEARDHVIRLLSRQPQSVQGHLLAAELALAANDQETAQKHLKKVSEIAPDSPASERARRMMQELSQS